MQLKAGRAQLTRRIAVAVTVLCTLAAIYFFGRHFLSLEELVERESSLRNWLDRFPIRSLLICFFAYVVVSFVPGTTGKSLAVGWLFGFWHALLIVNVALTVAATGSLLVGRHVLQDFVTSRFGGVVGRANRMLARDGGQYVLLLRLLHAPFTVVNYSLGATTIRTRTFWWTTQLGLLPGNIVFVYAGAQLPSIRSLADEGYWSLLTSELLLALTGLTVVPIAVRWIAGKFWKRMDMDDATPGAVQPNASVKFPGIAERDGCQSGNP